MASQPYRIGSQNKYLYNKTPAPGTAFRGQGAGRIHPEFFGIFFGFSVILSRNFTTIKRTEKNEHEKDISERIREAHPLV